jgi:hypothetical protein
VKGAILLIGIFFLLGRRTIFRKVSNSWKSIVSIAAQTITFLSWPECELLVTQGTNWMC